MVVFGITTSTKRASLSLHENGKLLGEIDVEVKKTHSTTILDQIDSLLEWTNKKLGDIDNVIVSIGPGSFTGVRIAISVIKGLFFGKNINIYSVNELDALAYQAYFTLENTIKENKLEKIYSLVDSGKEKIYLGKYNIKENKLENITYEVEKLDNIINEIINNQNKIVLIGDGVYNYKNKIIEKIGNKIEILNDNDLKIKASIFEKMFSLNLLEKDDLYGLKPNYLEKSQAERDKK